MPDFAAVTYFHHSGFTVSIQDTLLVFDYWRGEKGELSHGLGLGPKDFEDYSRILVFVSHDHEDHFDPVIYTWADGKLPITYIIADDMPKTARGRRMQPGDVTTVGDARIQAFGSTDKGVSFYVTLHGLHVFHAGDLNLWHWREESSLREIAQAESDFYAAMQPIQRLPMDIAMFPVDPRMGGMYDAGANYFVMSAKPRVMFPMHWFGRAEVAQTYARKGRTRYTEVVALTKPRERADLAFGEADLDIHVFSADPAAYADDDADAALKTYDDHDDPFSDTDLPVKL